MRQPSQSPVARLAAHALLLALTATLLPAELHASRTGLPPIAAERSESLGRAPWRPSESLFVAIAWDFDDRLIRVQKTDGTLVEHLYDADGNRVQTSTTLPGQPAKVVSFLVETSGGLSHVVAEVDGSSGLQALYVRGADDLLAVVRPDGAGGWTSRFYHADGIGSVRRLTDETGAVTDTYQYSAFGELIEHTGSDSQPYSFAGEPYDPNVGFQYHRARWMDPRVGRFAGLDPWLGTEEDPTSLHRYLYCGGSPVTSVDPTGRFEFSLGGMTFNISIANTIRAISTGAVYGAVLGGTDAYLRGDDALEGAWEGGLIGGITGGLFVVKFLRPVLALTGVMGGLVGTVDAIEQDNYALATFRGALSLAGSVAFFRTAPPPQAPATTGRPGKESTIQQLRMITMLLKERGWRIVAGGGDLPEEYLPPLSGKGTKGSNYVDLTAEKNGRTLRINTVTMRGVVPEDRELAAAALIRAKTPGDHLLLIPKQD